MPDLKEAYQSADHLRELIDTAAKMEGVVRNAGTHAAGVVISDRPLVEYLPLHRPTNNSEETPIKTVTQFEMGILEKLGMLKVDFLGLATLTIMARACDLIEQRHGVKYTLENIPTDDPETYKFLGEGNTLGVFQLEGSGMTKWLVQMKPAAWITSSPWWRSSAPARWSSSPITSAACTAKSQVEYRHPAMEPIFSDTYGIPIYQEQIMRAAVELAGYTPSESDDLRKAISKKKKEEIEKHRQKFIQGAVTKGMARETGEAIFTDWEEFARYGFNKSHAADYGVLAVQTGFLKLHYPVEYMTALLSVTKHETDKMALYINDARNMGVEVLPPDVNASSWDFTIEDRLPAPALPHPGQEGVARHRNKTRHPFWPGCDQERRPGTGGTHQPGPGEGRRLQRPERICRPGGSALGREARPGKPDQGRRDGQVWLPHSHARSPRSTRSRQFVAFPRGRGRAVVALRGAYGRHGERHPAACPGRRPA